MRSVTRWLATLLAAAAVASCGGGDEKPQPVPRIEAQAPAVSTTSDPAAAPAPAAPAQPVVTAIGRIDALEGDVRVGDRRAQSGMELLEGDVVKAADNAWALMTMSDGGTLTLRSNSELRFDRYRYAIDAEPQQNSATISLVKGAMRSITGYIGQQNRAGYEVRTATATIGIRGTDHEPAYYPPPAPGEKQEHPPGTYDKVNSGETLLRRPTGNVIVRRGQTAFAQQDVKARPQILARAPAFYAQHAQLDQRAAPRRQEFQRVYEQQREKQLQELKVRQEAARNAQTQMKQTPPDLKKQPDVLKKQAAAAKKADDKGRADQKKAQPQQNDQKKAAAAKKDEKKGVPAREDKKAAKDDRKSAKDDKKAALPPSVAARVQGMQRGDKSAASPQQAQPNQKDQKSRAEQQPSRNPFKDLPQQVQRQFQPQQQQQQQRGAAQQQQQPQRGNTQQQQQQPRGATVQQPQQQPQRQQPDARAQKGKQQDKKDK